jgi:hypothetical protein
VSSKPQAFPKEVTPTTTKRLSLIIFPSTTY